MSITFPARPWVKVPSRSFEGWLKVDLVYRAKDPYAVELCFHAKDIDVMYLFARELLRDGLKHTAGRGDVKITPGLLTVGILLSNGFEQTACSFDRGTLASFLAATYVAVPDGTESDHMDWSELEPQP